MKKGIKAGLIGKFLWPVAEALVERLWGLGTKCVNGKCVPSFLASCFGQQTHLKVGCILIITKLVLDVGAYFLFQGRNPFTTENFLMTFTAGLSTVALTSLGWCLLQFIAVPVILNYVQGAVDQTKQDHGECTFCGFVRTAWSQTRVPELLKNWFSPVDKRSLRWDIPADLERRIPSAATCLITTTLFVDPVVLHDMVFERDMLMLWLAYHGTHPVSRLEASMGEIRDAHELRDLIHRFATAFDLHKVPMNSPADGI